MTFTIPNIFIAGKKAVALEVNENFNAIKNELNRQNENLTTTAELAQKTEDYVNNNLKDELVGLIKTMKAYFCVNAGNINSEGHADLLVIDGISPMRVAFRVGDGLEGNFPSVIYSNYKGEQTTRTSLSPVDMTGKADGTYNIFAKIDGSPYALNNIIYRCASRPDLGANDIWLDTSCIPVRAIQFNGVSDYEFNDVPLGTATIEGGALKSVYTFPYNQNGFDINTSSIIETGSAFAQSIFHQVLPDYSRGVSKATGVSHTALQNGWIKVTAGLDGNTSASTTIGGSVFSYTTSTSYSAQSHLYPVAKDVVYSSSARTTLVFYPCIGN